MAIDVSKMGTKCPYCDGTGHMEATIGSRLRWLRKQSGETQEQIADALGVTRTSFTNMEADRQGVTQQNIRLICRHFGVSADWLLGIEP